MITKDSAIQFFYEHAGYNYIPGKETPEQGRMRCAMALADAEQWLDEKGGWAEWEEDICHDRSWLEKGDNRPIFVCFVYVPCQYCGARGESECMGGIDLGPSGQDEAYQRVVRAELALELMGRVEK